MNVRGGYVWPFCRIDAPGVARQAIGASTEADYLYFLRVSAFSDARQAVHVRVRHDAAGATAMRMYGLRVSIH